MKKIMLILAMSFAMISCSERNESNLTNEIQQEDVSFANRGKGSANFTFTLGRKSKNCQGFGICELAAFGVTIVEGPIKLTITKTLTEEQPDFQFSHRAYFELDSTLRDELDGLDDTTFYVDQDFYTEDLEGNKFLVHEGEYIFDSTLGEFGGYIIGVSII